MSETVLGQQPQTDLVDGADDRDDGLGLSVAASGAWDLLNKRLQQQATKLREHSEKLNQSRSDAFGQQEMNLLGRVRVRTEHNCIPRDMARVGDMLMLGFNVQLGLKKNTEVSDVFALYKLVQTEQGHEIELYQDHSFLDDSVFVDDFNELFSYYKEARLLQFHKLHDKVLAVFQIGARLSDIRVFRWLRSSDPENKQLKYIDNRGERDLPTPPAHDFEWTATTRESQELGRYPHINILDTIFVETINGQLTIKIENNTEDGQGIYREPVNDEHQSLDDAEIFYAKVGQLILLKIRPYREDDFRYLIYNCLTRDVQRFDEIGQSCVSLPEDHGIIFPGGYSLQGGDCRRFSDIPDGLVFERALRSPNGEDVLYFFHEQQQGISALFSYNLIEKSLQTPLFGHGYGLFEDGLMVIFRAENDQPSRVHPMQIWHTPFYADTHETGETVSGVMGRIGNAELVRGISELFGLCRSARRGSSGDTLADQKAVSTEHYHGLLNDARKLLDNFHWLGEAELVAAESTNLADQVRNLSAASEKLLDEYEKARAIREKAQKALSDASAKIDQLFSQLRSRPPKSPQELVDSLDQMRQLGGHLITLQEQRYIDLAALEQLQQQLEKQQAQQEKQTIAALSADDAFADWNQSITDLEQQITAAEKLLELEQVQKDLEKVNQQLQLVNEMMAGLEVADPEKRSKILEALSEVWGKLNQLRAIARKRGKSIGAEEAAGEFSARFRLLEQTVESALEQAETPADCDQQQAGVMAQLEELESRFADHDEFLSDLIVRREEMLGLFQTRRQSLVEARQRRADNLKKAAERIFQSIAQKSEKFDTADALNAWFSGDAMVHKLRGLIDQMRQLEAVVLADELSGKLNSARDQALRSLRDRSDLFEDGGRIIKLGDYKFNVNTRPMELTLIRQNDQLKFHLTGSDYYEKLAKHYSTLAESDHLYADQPLVSENAEVARAEYLVAEIIDAAEKQTHSLTLPGLEQALSEGELLSQVSKFASKRYQDSYAKGIHDHDACKILEQLLPLRANAGLLRFAPLPRALAQLWWMQQSRSDQQQWLIEAANASRMQLLFNARSAVESLQLKLQQSIEIQLNHLGGESQGYPLVLARDAAAWLIAEFAVDASGNQRLEFTTSELAQQLAEQLQQQLAAAKQQSAFKDLLKSLSINQQFIVASQWLGALIGAQDSIDDGSTANRYIAEAAVLLIDESKLNRRVWPMQSQVSVDGLLSEHSTIKNGQLSLAVDEFEQRLNHFRFQLVPGFKGYQKQRQKALSDRREALKLEEYQAKPMSGFVRNKLINQVYLPLVGANLAKQLGAAGGNSNSDRSGLLLLISPPGYGKTTLVEYIASRLGLVFIKVNGPALGHKTTSLDPALAPDSGAARELERLNLALAMGNNVMLVVDDIQHTHPEFLQKFISLCDGTRRIEGVINGEPRTFDMRGKRFCVVMAGNPYTESGEAFSIPDMLANRADIYNLGDLVGGSENAFSLSYVENALASNEVLRPLVNRDMADIYLLIDLARGEAISTDDLGHEYAAAELDEITGVLKKLLRVQQVLLAVNQQYIASAAQDDRYREEPPFRLQGSYRNMARLSEKVSAVMNDQELEQLIDDHYKGEAQTLTTGAEENVLKLKQLRGVLTEVESLRWGEICSEYKRLRTLGDQDDPTAQAVSQLSVIASQLQKMSNIDNGSAEISREISQLKQQLQHISEVDFATVLSQSFAHSRPNVEVINQPQPGIDKVLQALANTIETSLLPVVKAMDHKLKMDHDIWQRVKKIGDDLQQN
ncbi:DNA repair ATPase [Pelagibaculum spongiae]|uniref:DNA repair protein n=1 Tax=Pelagibaculum spongiae TaxID=2080658 RepID=A0A2V1GTP9_9GAMM|nr:DNA repair ATPase [Pelagibaculum spongiae]PVZ65442.1 DNA repair protein [Pelagibaculum spongiae]